MPRINPDYRWVFVGDSITDCGRREDADGHLGHGYVRLIRDWLLAKAPADAPRVVNVGVSGNTIRDLAARWERDVIAAHPTTLSIMIGVNDVWRQLAAGREAEGVPLKEYVTIYQKLIADAVAADPKVEIVLCEPTVISPPQPARGNELLLPYAMAVRELSAMYPNVRHVVGYHHTCLAAERARPDVAWWPDGVHPGSAGHMLLARTWLGETGLL